MKQRQRQQVCACVCLEEMQACGCTNHNDPDECAYAGAHRKPSSAHPGDTVNPCPTPHPLEHPHIYTQTLTHARWRLHAWSHLTNRWPSPYGPSASSLILHPSFNPLLARSLVCLSVCYVVLSSTPDDEASCCTHRIVSSRLASSGHRPVPPRRTAPLHLGAEASGSEVVGVLLRLLSHVGAELWAVRDAVSEAAAVDAASRPRGRLERAQAVHGVV